VKGVFKETGIKQSCLDFKLTCDDEDQAANKNGRHRQRSHFFNLLLQGGENGSGNSNKKKRAVKQIDLEVSLVNGQQAVFAEDDSDTASLENEFN